MGCHSCSTRAAVRTDLGRGSGKKLRQWQSWDPGRSAEKSMVVVTGKHKQWDGAVWGDLGGQELENPGCRKITSAAVIRPWMLVGKDLS